MYLKIILLFFYFRSKNRKIKKKSVTALPLIFYLLPETQFLIGLIYHIKLNEGFVSPISVKGSHGSLCDYVSRLHPG